MRVGSKLKDHRKTERSKYTAKNPIRYGKGKGEGRNGNVLNGGSPAWRGTRAMQKAADATAEW